jgi:ubiquitin C-terminal hydrolase
MREVEYAKPGTNTEALKLSKARRNALNAKVTFAARRLQPTQNAVMPRPTSSAISTLSRSKRALPDQGTDESRKSKKLADERRANDVESKMLKGKALKGKTVKARARQTNNEPVSRRSPSDSNVSKSNSDTTLGHSTSSNSTAATTPPKGSPEADIFTKGTLSKPTKGVNDTKAAEEVSGLSEDTIQTHEPVRATEESSHGSVDPVETPGQFAVDAPKKDDSANLEEVNHSRDDEPSVAAEELAATVASPPPQLEIEIEIEKVRRIEANDSYFSVNQVSQPNPRPNGVGLKNPQHGCYAIAVIQYIFRTISAKALRILMRDLLEMDDIEVPDGMEDLKRMIASKYAVKALVELLEDMTTKAEMDEGRDGPNAIDVGPFLRAFGETQKRFNVETNEWLFDWNGHKQQDACEFFEILMDMLRQYANSEPETAAGYNDIHRLFTPFATTSYHEQICQECGIVNQSEGTDWTVPILMRQQTEDSTLHKLSALIAKREKRGCFEEDEDKCPNNQTAILLGETRIVKAPDHLAINFDRSDQVGKLPRKRRVDVRLDDVLTIPFGTSMAKYRLHGFIKHFGKSMGGGHYRSYWIPPGGGNNSERQSLVCNDSTISKMRWNIARTDIGEKSSSRSSRNDPTIAMAFYFRVPTS